MTLRATRRAFPRAATAALLLLTIALGAERAEAGRPGARVGAALGGKASAAYRAGKTRLRRPRAPRGAAKLGAGPALTLRTKTQQVVGYLDANHYRDVKTVALKIMRQHPPDRSFYVAVGRSPVAIASFMAELNSNMVMTFPASDMRKTIEPEWKQQYFEHFRDLIPDDVLTGQRTIVLFDRSRPSSGTSLARLRGFLEEYLQSIGSTTKVVAIGLSPTGPLAEGVELMSTQDHPHLFFYQQGGFDHDEDVAPFLDKHRIGVNQLEQLKENRNHARFRTALGARMAQDADLDGVLRGEFGPLLDPEDAE